LRVKVAWITPGFSSDERDWCIPALLDLARVLAARFELHVFALRYPYRVDRYTVHGATVHAIGGGHGRRWTAPGVWRGLIDAVTREHRRGRFDVLHAFWLWEPGVIAAWLKSRLHARTVISIAGGELIDLPQIAYGYAGRRVYRFMMRWALRRADVVTAGSRGLLEILNRWAGNGRRETPRRMFAPLGVDMQMFHRRQELPGVEPLRAGRHPEMSTMVSVGSLQRVKGQADLIRAFRLVVDRHTDAHLKIVGDGPLRAELESLADELGVGDRVEFAGEVRREELPAIYREATLFVQSSLHEAQGMALLEAAACGLPIVGTGVGTLADLAPDAALATPVGDPIRLAQAILSLLESAAHRRRLGDAAYQRVVQVYALDATADRFAANYES
jgi:glycosyltransferase involved in cell wall biosynthesis